jgi:amino acid transporter
VAILISTLTAVIWYLLAIVCLFRLRHKEPELFRPYKVPAYPWMPAFVGVLAGVAAFVYAWVNVQVVLPTACLYVGALVWYMTWGHKKVLPVSPEEVAARIAQQLAHQSGRTDPALAEQTGNHLTPAPAVVDRTTGPILMPSDPLYTRQLKTILERFTGPLLLLGLLSLAWMLLRAVKVLPVFVSEAAEVTLAVGVWAVLFVVVSLVGFLSTRPNRTFSRR